MPVSSPGTEEQIRLVKRNKTLQSIEGGRGPAREDQKNAFDLHT